MLTAYGRVAQRITRLTTDQKIAGSNPAAVMLFFFAENHTCLFVRRAESIVSAAHSTP